MSEEEKEGVDGVGEMEEGVGLGDEDCGSGRVLINWESHSVVIVTRDKDKVTELRLPLVSAAILITQLGAAIVTLMKGRKIKDGEDSQGVSSEAVGESGADVGVGVEEGVLS